MFTKVPKYLADFNLHTFFWYFEKFIVLFVNHWRVYNSSMRSGEVSIAAVNVQLKDALLILWNIFILKQMF